MRFGNCACIGYSGYALKMNCIDRCLNTATPAVRPVAASSVARVTPRFCQRECAVWGLAAVDGGKAKIKIIRRMPSLPGVVFATRYASSGLPDSSNLRNSSARAAAAPVASDYTSAPRAPAKKAAERRVVNVAVASFTSLDSVLSCL